MTGFTAPPSTTDSTTPLFKCVPGQDFYHPQMEYTRACVVIRFQINGTRIIPVLVPYCFTIKLVNSGFSYTNAGLERAASNLGFQMSQMACDLKTNANANTQRIVDVLNNHWQSDLQQRYNDARLELSQQKQNATLIAALKTTAAA